MDKITYFYYRWEQFEIDIPKIIQMIRVREKNRPSFEGIYGVPRGGLVLAVRLSHELNLPMVMGGVTKNIIVVDDIADTGATLIPYKDRGALMITAFYRSQSKIEPDIWLHRNDNDWIVYPWEKDPNKKT